MDTNQTVGLLVLVLSVGCVVSARGLPFVDFEDPSEVTRKHQLL